MVAAVSTVGSCRGHVGGGCTLTVELLGYDDVACCYIAVSAVLFQDTREQVTISTKRTGLVARLRRNVVNQNMHSIACRPKVNSNTSRSQAPIDT